MAARAISSGTISFGLVSIPVKLYTATSPQSVSFNMLHAKCGGRLKQQYICPTDNNEVVTREQTIKGFEFARDNYVQFTDEELKKLESAKTNDLELVAFVPESTVDLIYIDKTYFLGPDKGGDRAYRLLSDAMHASEKIAVGRFWTRGKEQLVLVRPYKKGLMLHQVYYADEVRSFDDVETGGEMEFKPIERELAEKLIEQLKEPRFAPEQYRDEYADRVKAAIEAKISGREVVVANEAPKAQVIDLLEALKKSIADVKSASAENKGAGAKSDEAKPLPHKAKGPKKASAEKPAEGKSAKKNVG